MTNRNSIPVDVLKAFVDYDPATGEFTWRARSGAMMRTTRRCPEVMAKVWNTQWAGKPAFKSNNQGYLYANLHATPIKAARAAWVFISGEWPPAGLDVDHINGDRGDNRPENLRLVTPTQNSRNKRIARNNKSGVSGVRWCEQRGRWEAKINGGPNEIHLGSYFTKDEAVAARQAAEKVLKYSDERYQEGRPYYECLPRAPRKRSRASKQP